MNEVRKEGFADVARWIALDSDGETSIYRRFQELSARNILYLQAELLLLEKQLSGFDQDDTETDDMNVKDAARTWEVLIERQNESSDARLRMDVIEKIRTKLREYRALAASFNLQLKSPIGLT